MNEWMDDSRRRPLVGALSDPATSTSDLSVGNGAFRYSCNGALFPLMMESPESGGWSSDIPLYCKRRACRGEEGSSV